MDVKIVAFCFFLYILKVISISTPNIGILTLPCADSTSNCPSSVVSGATTYLPTDYVKWIESGGARVVPIRADEAHANVRTLLAKLNGVVFTGGGASFSSGNIWWEQVNNIMDYMVEFHTSSRAIPLWGTCLGFQAMINVANGKLITVDRSAEDIALNLDFTSTASTSRMFDNTRINKQYSQAVYYDLSHFNLTMNYHNYGIAPSAFTNDARVKGNFTLLATSLDTKGETFAALVEGTAEAGLYWYGSQFHPEIPEYQGGTVHTVDAMYVNTYFSQFFVDECRIRNSNSMTSADYTSLNIYNWPPHYIKQGYGQVYIFPKA